MALKKFRKYYLLALVVIILDQALKLWTYFNFEYGEERMLIPDWARLHYVLNNGIAYGIEMDFPYGKFILTLVRVIAVFAIAYMISYLGKRKAHTGLLWTMGLILGGAFGNMIDSVFYGVLLEDNLAYNAPFAWFHGRVIDMLYFPLMQGTFPTWLPVWGGESFEFFKPIFNIADAAISVAFVVLIFRQRKFFAIPEDEKPQEAEAESKPQDEKPDGDSTPSSPTPSDESPQQHADEKT
jgi:signal peptidase II